MTDSGIFTGQGAVASPKGLQAQSAKRRGHDGDHVGGLQHRSHRHEMRHRQPQPPPDAGALDDLIHHAMAGALGHDGHMLGGAELADRHARAGQRMIVTKDADIGLSKQPALEEASLQGRRKPIARSTRPRSISSFTSIEVVRTVRMVTPGAMPSSVRISLGRK